MNSNKSAEERRELWHQTFHTTYDECEDWDYGQWIVELIRDRFDFLESLFGAERAAPVLFDLLAEANTVEGYRATTWREALDNAGPISWTVWEICDVFSALGLYGRFGVTDAEIPEDSRERHIQKMLSAAIGFLERADIQRIAGKDNQLSKIVALAQSRWNLDHATGEVDPASLAILGGISEGRVRNMMSGGGRAFENTGGRVSAASAFTWLQERPTFFNSIWQQPDDAARETPGTDALEDVVFVPVAADATIFHPGLVRSGKYTIGAKGDEVQCATFEEALGALQKMATPRWRRPNEAGNWGIVSGRDWKRIERRALSSY